jgi:Zn-dependent protease
MDTGHIIDGLIWYMYLVIIITFHEFAHAWTASQCGDDTARSQGRVTLNPISHMDPIGTVLLPFLMVFLSAAGSNLGRFIIGWGRPVPVNSYRLRHPNRDDVLVAMAGPIMNVILAFAVLALARLGAAAGAPMLVEIGYELAQLSMLLCFFNLIPVPPLDGSYLLRHLTGMSHEAFIKFSRFGFFIIIILIQFREVRRLLAWATYSSLEVMSKLLFF